MPRGNGVPRVTINAVEKAPGWVVFEPGDASPNCHDLPVLLNQTLCAWLGERADIQVISTLGIVADGTTIAIHVWFDV